MKNLFLMICLYPTLAWSCMDCRERLEEQVERIHCQLAQKPGCSETLYLVGKLDGLESALYVLEDCCCGECP